MKLYYDDALQAAYMVREFGVQININKEGELFVGQPTEILLNHAKYKQRKNPKHDRAIYEVDLDSYAIFKPMVGDVLGIFKKGCTRYRRVVDEFQQRDNPSNSILAEKAFEYIAKNQYQAFIALRKNKAFFTPLREE